MLSWILIAFLTTTGLYILLGRKPEFAEALVTVIFTSAVSWVVTKILFGYNTWKTRREERR